MKHRVRPPTPEETPPNDEETPENRPFRWIANVRFLVPLGELEKYYVSEMIEAERYLVLMLAGSVDRKTVWIKHDVILDIEWQKY